MTDEERAMIKRDKGDSVREAPQHKDERKTRVWLLKLFGRIVEIRVISPNK